MILLSPLVIIILFIELMLIFLTLGSLFGSIKIFRYWDFNSFEPRQYRLENINYLLSISGKILVSGKLLSFIFIIYVTDSLSSLITGAMCAAGIFDSVNYSDIMLSIRLLTLFFIILWIILDMEDIKRENFPFIKKKAIIFFISTIFVLIDAVLLVHFFFNIDSSEIVRCCGSIYNSYGDLNAASGNLVSIIAVFLFIVLSFFLILLETHRTDMSILFLNIVFFLLSVFIIIHFFSPYIYELPTHNCPFCIFKPEYYYIGYPIFILLIGGSFSGIYSVILKKISMNELFFLKKVSIIFKILFILLVLYFPVIYYIKNGVFL